MSVFWLIPAQDQLQDAIAQSDDPSISFSAALEELSATLQETFGDAAAIIVIERINGFSKELKNHVLRVEYVDGRSESHAAIVKFAGTEKLAAELDGWQSCARPSNSRGVVAMPLRAGATTADGHLRTIVYEDAKQKLRPARLISLEDAALTSCRWDDPEFASLEHVLNELFVEMRGRLYQRAHTENDPSKLADELLTRLYPGITAWERPHSQQEDCRQMVMRVLPGSVADLLDPMDYLHRLLGSRRHLPEVMRGCVHGDLHGRNILVGIDGEKASFCAVFDYEDMSSDGLTGWDFAKLETELKVRAYQGVFHDDETDFILKVYEFEEQLAEATLARGKSATWGRATKTETPTERLFAILIGLRRWAMESLAREPQRCNSWLHEYFFLLAAYGLYAGRFSQTYGRRQFLAAFISAAAASAQHAWAKNASGDLIARSAAKAKLAIHDRSPDERPDIDTAESYHLPLAFASEFCRSREPTFITACTEILEALREKFPYVVEIWQELALAHLELLDLSHDPKYLHDAKSVLSRLDTRYPYRSHCETLCRQGRLLKDCGDASFFAGNHEAMRNDYREALNDYLQAYKQGNHYYPGINVATLYLLLGKAKPSMELAEKILEELESLRQVPDDELTWVLATKAEANLLLGDCEEAAILYEQATERPDCLPHHRSAMHKQLQRILRIKPCDGTDFDSIFGCEDPPA